MTNLRGLGIDSGYATAALKAARSAGLEVPNSITDIESVISDVETLASTPAPKAPELTATADVSKVVKAHAKALTEHGSIAQAVEDIKPQLDERLRCATVEACRAWIDALAESWNNDLASLAKVLPNVPRDAQPASFIGNVEAFGSYSTAVELAARLDAGLLLREALSAPIERISGQYRTVVPLLDVPDVRTAPNDRADVVRDRNILRGVGDVWRDGDYVIRMQSQQTVRQAADRYRDLLEYANGNSRVVSLSLAPSGRGQTRADNMDRWDRAWQLADARSASSWIELSELTGNPNHRVIKQ